MLLPSGPWQAPQTAALAWPAFASPGCTASPAAWAMPEMPTVNSRLTINFFIS
jgi:hypothetical protein